MKLKLMLAALAAAGTMGSAQATVQTYDFTAILDSVGSFNEFTWSDSGEGIAVGSRVNKGDLIKGRLSFDDALPFSAWNGLDPHSGSPGDYSYNSTPLHIVELSYTFMAIGQHFSARNGNILLENDTWNADVIRIQTESGARSDHTYQQGDIALISSNLSTFIDGSIPSELQLSAFDRPYLVSYWHRGSDKGRIRTLANITSLVRVNDVPEPASAALMLAALAGMGVAARRNRKAVFAHA